MPTDITEKFYESASLALGFRHPFVILSDAHKARVREAAESFARHVLDSGWEPPAPVAATETKPASPSPSVAKSPASP